MAKQQITARDRGKHIGHCDRAVLINEHTKHLRQNSKTCNAVPSRQNICAIPCMRTPSGPLFACLQRSRLPHTHTHIRTHTGDHSKNVRAHARDYANTLTHDHSRCSPPINIRTLLSYSSCGPDVRAPSVSPLPLPLLPDISNVATSRPRSVCTCLTRCVPDPCILILLPRSYLLITFDRDSKIRKNNQHRHQHRNRQQFQLLASKRKTTAGRVQTRQTRVTIARPSLVCVCTWFGVFVCVCGPRECVCTDRARL